MRDSVKRIKTLTKRNLLEILRDPLNLAFMLGLPLLMEVLFYAIFHKMTAQFEIKYLAPGIVVFSQAFLTLFSGLLIALDRSTSFLTRLYVSSARSHEFIFGYTFSLLPISLLQTVLFFVVGGLLDFSFWSITMLLGILFSLVTSFLFIGLGILFGSLCTEKSIGGVSSAVVMGQSLLSGMWFPTEGMGKGFMAVMNALPFRNATLLLQNAVNGYQDLFTDLVRPLLILAAYAVVAFTAAILVFRRNMKNV